MYESIKMKEKDFWALNALRFVLALYLVLFHTLGPYPVLDGTVAEAALNLGNMATTVFFVLSGFLLTHVYIIVKDNQEINKKNFLVARLASFYPLHIIGFLFALANYFVTTYIHGGLAVPVEPFGPSVRMLGKHETILAIFMNLALLNAWNPYYLVFNIPSWSLSALLCYYLVFPFIAPKLFRVRHPVLALAILGALFIAPGVTADLFQRTDLFTDGFLHRNPIIRFPIFLSGIVLCVLFSRSNSLAHRRLKFIGLGSVVLATISFSVQLKLQGNYHSHMIRNGLYLPAALALVWICADARANVGKGVRYWSSRLGSASLPMFLLHVPLFEIFMRAEKLVTALYHSGPSTTFSSLAVSAKNIEQGLPAYLIYIIPLIVVCVFIQEKFVVPMQTKIRQRFLLSKAHRAQSKCAPFHLGMMSSNDISHDEKTVRQC